jgi:hypothetical protein
MAKNNTIARSEAKHSKRSIPTPPLILLLNMLNGNILARHIPYNQPYAAQCRREACSTGKEASKAAYNPERPGGKATGVRA